LHGVDGGCQYEQLGRGGDPGRAVERLPVVVLLQRDCSDQADDRSSHASETTGSMPVSRRSTGFARKVDHEVSGTEGQAAQALGIASSSTAMKPYATIAMRLPEVV
jgi:hypothetical protein